MKGVGSFAEFYITLGGHKWEGRPSGRVISRLMRVCPYKAVGRFIIVSEVEVALN